MLKVRAHTCYLGYTGYAAHSRNFFRELSKYVELRIRNFTWDENPGYLDSLDYSILDKITLYNDDKSYSDYEIKKILPGHLWKDLSDNFIPDVDIVLMDVNHHYFYEFYKSKVTIAYTVWESTELPKDFFNQLLKFDYLWVATEWHRERIVEQGYPQYRVFVVNEGVDISFKDIIPVDLGGKFKFMFFGRWDYRKSVPEIIESFISAFPNNDNVELVLNADNPFSVDGFKSTEDRLQHYGFNDNRIVVKHFMDRKMYLDYIKSGNVLVTCARSEGWNIPLIEAMSAGTPVIYSDYGAQLEFAAGLGNPVKIKGELSADIGSKLGFSGDIPGMYAEPDYSDLKRVMIDCYNNYMDKKTKAILESDIICNKFSWEKVTKDAYDKLLLVTDIDFPLPSNEESVVIMSHADTTEKIEILKRSILSMRRQGYPVIVSTHIQVPDEIYNISNYVICDKDNPIIYYNEFESLSNVAPIYYANDPMYNLKYMFDYNHGYAAFKLIKVGLGVSEMSEYSITHFLNYDNIITERLFETNSKLLKEKNVDIIAYKHESDMDSITTGLFSVKNEKMIPVLKTIKTKKDFFRYPNRTLFEDIFWALCKDSLSMEVRSFNDVENKNLINNYVLRTYPFIKLKKDHTVGIYLAHDGKNFYIACTNNKDQIDIEIKVDGDVHRYVLYNYPVLFVGVTSDMVKDGIDVSIPKYNIIKHLNLDTRTAFCEIHNYSVVKYIERRKHFTPIIHYIDGPYVEIISNYHEEFRVEFINNNTGDVLYSVNMNNNCWAKCNKKYFINWKIKITSLTTGAIYEEYMDLTRKNVLISIDSKSLGDSLAWFPHIEEFRKKWNCIVWVSTFKNELFRNQYPELNFVEPGTVVRNVNASFCIGWYFNDKNEPNMDYHPSDFRKFPMQKTTSDILGLEYSVIKPKLQVPEGNSPIDGEYVCFGIHSTAQTKYWNNPNGWQELTDYFLSQNIKVIILSSEGNGYMGNYYPNGSIEKSGPKTLENAMLYLKYCKMFIGVSSGLSWLSWSMNVPTVIISGFTRPITEMEDENIIRIFKGGSCNGCCTWSKLDPGDWNWCPKYKGTSKQFECSKIITSKQVIDEIEKYWENKKSIKSLDVLIQESYELGMMQNYKEIYDASEFVKKMNIKNFIEIGTDQGGTFAIWSKLSSKEGIKISLDMPHGDYGKTDYSVEKRDEYLNKTSKNVYIIHGDSHHDPSKNEIKNILKGEKVDLLFIDGDHVYDGVKQDYMMYKEFVKSGGWIGFHDIKDTQFHRDANCRVDVLWNELEGEKIEFIDKTSEWGGIGFIKVR